MATLAALEARRACPDTAKLDISCYTFGAPRTGNHAFAREYNKAVPDTWGVINDQANPSPHRRSGELRYVSSRLWSCKPHLCAEWVLWACRRKVLLCAAFVW